MPWCREGRNSQFGRQSRVDTGASQIEGKPTSSSGDSERITDEAACRTAVVGGAWLATPTSSHLTCHASSHGLTLYYNKCLGNLSSASTYRTSFYYSCLDR
ncbi:hypothetical protein E2C01_068585 [Portunus trituberculatus]|uniref:Uncharacterized protein n=1 Tax=Portunus trituberculatus TaxID=210409 RepID=A0A5B7HSD6_PORTR|nr:hypothetical protein [Portunus trituberculatus]